jgi:imidazolonepropionase-like amidohydrolase
MKDEGWMFQRRLLVTGVLGLLAALPPAVRADSGSDAETSGAKATSRAEVILVKAGKVYAGPEKVIRDGFVLIEDGKVAAIGTDLTAPEGARVIDRPNGTITAGLIDANSAAGFASPINRAEHALECIPHLRVIDMIDLGHRDFDHLASAGVTTVYISADSASVIGAQGSIVKTGGPLRERVVRGAYGVKATVGREPIYKGARSRTPYRGTTYLTRRPTTRMGLVWVFRKSFHDAMILAKGDTPHTRGEGSPSDEAIPYLQKILKGEIPLRIQARAQLDILTAIRLSDEFDLPFILEDATDANRCVNELREHKIPVIFGPLFDYPVGFRAASREMDRYRYSTPSVLLDAGITLALSANGLSGEASLPRQAMYAMRVGLSRRQALAAVTTTPAKLLGIADTAGSIEEGRPADLVVWSGEPFEATTRADVVVIGGSVVKALTGD